MKLSIPLVSLTSAHNKKFCCHCPLRQMTFSPTKLTTCKKIRAQRSVVLSNKTAAQQKTHHGD